MSTIVVTGASAGLGLSISKYLLADSRKHRLILCCNSNDQPLKQLSNEPSNADRVFIIKGDTADESFVKTVFAQSLVHFQIDRIDALVLNHGTLGDGTRVADGTQEMWEQVFRVNFFSIVGIVCLCSALVRCLLTYWAADTAHYPLPTRKPRPHYSHILRSCGEWYDQLGPIWYMPFALVDDSLSSYQTGASKAAINHLAKTLAREEKSIITVSIRPGMVDTGMQELIRGEASRNMDEEDRLRFVGAYESGKLLSPDKPGHVMAKLATEASKELSGQFITWNDPKLAKYQDS